MLIDLSFLHKKYDLSVSGIIHAGAHEAEEFDDYRKVFGDVPTIWIEGNPDLVNPLCEKFEDYDNNTVVNAVVSDAVGDTVKFNLANNGQSSSILELGVHKRYHPEVSFIGSVELKTTTIDSIVNSLNSDNIFNFINLDLQGVELRALRGAIGILGDVDYIYTEVNDRNVYKKCDKIDEIDDFLSFNGFRRVETSLTPFHWGDAFYIRGA